MVQPIHTLLAPEVKCQTSFLTYICKILSTSGHVFVFIILLSPVRATSQELLLKRTQNIRVQLTHGYYHYEQPPMVKDAILDEIYQHSDTVSTKLYRLNHGALQQKQMNNRISPKVKQIWNVAMHVLHNFLGLS